MTTTTLDEMRGIDSAIAVVYGKRNREIATKEMYARSLRHATSESRAQACQQRIDEVDARIAKLNSEIDKLNESYSGWTRFFHVKHLHSSANCSSFRWNTRIVFVPEISGLTEEEAVAKFGTDLCTICFKSAPTE